MPDNDNDNVQEVVVTQPNNEVEANYLEQIKYLKENTVSKDLYEKALAENKKLLSDYVNGTMNVENKEVEVTLEQARLAYQKPGMDNLEQAKATLQLREKMMENGLGDPFLANGVDPTVQDITDAQKVADFLQSCIDTAQGDAAVFQAEFYRGLQETPMAAAKKGTRR